MYTSEGGGSRISLCNPFQSSNVRSWPAEGYCMELSAMTSQHRTLRMNFLPNLMTTRAHPMIAHFNGAQTHKYTFSPLDSGLPLHGAGAACIRLTDHRRPQHLPS
jgi:hypothetical protein